MIKINRSQPAPASLSSRTTYNDFDVVNRLKIDFYNKCYICEITNLQDPEVEHLKPHKSGTYLDLKYDWNNLFLSCGHCNNVKAKSEYDNYILDCCTIDPEEHLILELVNNNVKITAKTSDIDSTKTAKLIYNVFNLQNTGLRVLKSECRLKELQKEMNILYTLLKKYKDNPNSPLILKKLEVTLRKESAFAGFKRSYIRENINSYANLTNFI